ncbi:hypothetical protein JXL21_04720, partial [Candidatus Bathyarchaeota archaeon]|nr:hypothetical protein [Candidatus Bathyarchaeota archaeon]
SINMGWNFGYGAVAVMIGYSLFHRVGGGSSRRELTFLLITSVTSMGVYQTLGFILYMLETEPLASYPTWIAPPMEVIQAKDLSLRHWIGPITFFGAAAAVSLAAGFIYYTVLRDELNRNPKMVWPNQAATTKLVDACMTGGGSARLVALSAAIGFTITMLQNLPMLWGIDLTTLDLSGLLPPGCILVISLSLGFAGIGYLISPKTSLSLLASGMISYLLVTPALVRRGLLEPTGDAMALYQDYLMNYAMGPAIGVLLLGGILLSVVMLAKNRLTKNTEKTDNGETGYLELYKVLIQGILGNRKYLAAITAIFTLVASLAYTLNPFAPLPPLFAVGFTAYCFFVGGFVEAVFISKMQAQTGMGMGIGSVFFYDLPLFTAGYRAFTGYFIYPYLRPNPWLGNGTLPYYKYRDETRVSWRDIITAKVVGYVPTFLFSVFFTLVLWKYVGFGTPMMPAAGLIQSKVYVTMLATGDISTVLNPWTFLAGGVVGSILEVFTPVSMMGLGMGLLFPPHYIIPFGVGGLMRLATERRYGKEFYEEKGRLIVTGLMASSLLVQVLMTILTNLL